MTDTKRRNMIRVGLAFFAIPTTILHLVATSATADASRQTDASASRPAGMKERKPKGGPMKIQYLEIVTPDVDAVCEAYGNLHNIEFGDGDPGLGGARTAKMADGGLIGVRAPMHDAEEPVVRPYTLVEDIEGAVETAKNAGAEVAVPPMELPGHGKCAIVVHGGVQMGLWST